MVLKVCVHEWLSGGVSPCQGEGRGFESRLVLSMIEKRVIRWMALFSMFEPSRARTVRMSTLRSGRRRRTSPGCSATPRALFYKDIQCGCPFFVKKSFTSGVYYKKLLEKVCTLSKKSLEKVYILSKSRLKKFVISYITPLKK